MDRRFKTVAAFGTSCGYLCRYCFRILPFGLRPAVILITCTILWFSMFILPPPAFAGDKSRNRADRAVRDGDFELAERLYREMLSKDPHNTEARLGLGFTLYKMRNLHDAFDHAARVISEEPLSSGGHSLLGLVILTSGDFRRSIEEFRTALSLKSDDARAIAGLAMVDFYENRMDRSVQGLRRAAYIDPREPDYVFDLGQVASRTEHFREAADAYERFLVIAPKTDTDRRNRIRGLIDFLRYLGDQGTLYSTSGQSRTSLAFERSGVRPIIQVRLNGSQEILRFVLDTGSGMSVVSEKTARRLGLKPVARGGLARGVGGLGRFEIVYSFLSSMDIGDVHVSNVPVYIRQIYVSDTEVDGYIGLSVISKYIATIDYGTWKFTLARRRDSDEDAAVQTPDAIESDAVTRPKPARVDIPLRFTSSGFLSGEVRLDGVDRPLNFIIDTGADISVVSEALFKTGDIDGFARGQRIPIYGAAGIADSVMTLLLPRVSLGAHAREGIQAAVLDLEPINETAGFDQVGILGANFLRHFRVTFDFQKSIMRLERIQGDAKKEEVVPRNATLPE